MWICWSKQQHTWIFWRVKRWWRWHWTQQKEGNSKTLWEDKKLGLELSCACFKICCFNMISKILLVNVTTTNKCPPLSINSQNFATLTSIPMAPNHTLAIHIISTEFTWSISNLWYYTYFGWVDLLYPVPHQANPCHQKSQIRLSTSYLLTIYGQPATYWPYMVNFKLHLYFPGVGGGNNQT